MTVINNVKKLFLILIALLAFPAAEAQLQIEIISGNASALPIAIVPFEWQVVAETPENRVDEVVSGDLYRSGLFDPMDVDDMAERPVDAEGIRFGTWRLLKVDYIVVGKVRTPRDGAGYEIIYQLFDVHTQEELLSRITTVGPGDLRFGSHRVADAIYEALTGVPVGILSVGPRRDSTIVLPAAGLEPGV